MWKRVAAVILAVNVLAAFFGRGSFAHGVLALAVPAYIGIPAAVLALLARLLRKGTLARWAFVVAIVAASGVLSIGPGKLLLRRDLANAKAYCEALVPRLEEHRRIHGSYPKSVDAQDAPRLIDRRTFYTTDGRAYFFSIVDPAGLLNVFVYDSTTKKWEQSD
jgi:hypothetical protein